MKKENKHGIALDFCETGVSETVPGKCAVWIMLLFFVLILLPITLPLLGVSFLVRARLGKQKMSM